MAGILFASLAVPFIAIWIYGIPNAWNLYFGKGGASFGDPVAARALVVSEFLASWDDYVAHGWGFDSYAPLSHRVSNLPGSGEPLGWIIIDSLDTLMLMYNGTDPLSPESGHLFHEIKRCESWIEKDLSYDIDSFLNVFELTIRMLGGLLSAHHLSANIQWPENNKVNPDTFLTKAVDLGDRLIKVFESTETGIPNSDVNLHTGASQPSHITQGASSTAEFTTLQLEFKYLSYLTDNATYWEVVERVYEPLYRNNEILEIWDGLVPIFTYPGSGKFHNKELRFGSRGDSFYEYLLKQYLMFHEERYRMLYRASMNGMQKHLLSQTKTKNKLHYIGERSHGLEGSFSSKMDHLVCFIGGVLAMGATEGLPYREARRTLQWDSTREEDWNLAKSLTKTCHEMYKQSAYGICPEIVVFQDGTINTEQNPTWWKSTEGDFFVKSLDVHNLQRPETVESLMFLYHLTGDDIYRHWGFDILKSFQRHAKTQREDGHCPYTSLKDCIHTITKADSMESFWLSETLKYLYLLFQDEVNLRDIVFNTEAHPFPVLSAEDLQRKGLKTNWKL